LEPASAAPSASIARRSISQFSANFEKIVNKGGMNHGIGRGRAAAQAFQILQIAAMHLGACSSNRLGGCFGTREAEHFDVPPQSVQRQPQTDKAARAGNEKHASDILPGWIDALFGL